MSDLNEARLSDWLHGNVAGFASPFAVQKFAGGQSNPTYRINAASGSYVVRRKPFGKLLPSAHAVDREYRILTALYPTGFPVARPLQYCDDDKVIGSEFYVRDFAQGRLFWDGMLPDMAPASRRDIYFAMIDTLAQLHSADIDTLGLRDFGKSGNYFERQVARWKQQYRASEFERIDAMERLIEWLPRSLPPRDTVTIVHGDYRIDNLIFDTHVPVVRAVLDWELSTLGDPLADLAYLLMNWVMDMDGRAAIGGTDLLKAGIPSLQDATERYAKVAGRATIPDLDWHFAFNMFRGAAIVQGIRNRIAAGNASSGDAAPIVAKLIPFADAGWRFAQKAGA